MTSFGQVENAGDGGKKNSAAQELIHGVFGKGIPLGQVFPPDEWASILQMETSGGTIGMILNRQIERSGGTI